MRMREPGVHENPDCFVAAGPSKQLWTDWTYIIHVIGGTYYVRVFSAYTLLFNIYYVPLKRVLKFHPCT